MVKAMGKKGVPRGVELARSIWRKRNPSDITAIPDGELLGYLIGEKAGNTVLEVIGSAEKFFEIQPRELMYYPGIGEATAAQLEVLGEWILRCLGERGEAAVSSSQEPAEVGP